MSVKNHPAADYSLGDFVYLPEQPDWGRGQVQSVIGSRVTVNFDHAGKQLINTEAAQLTPLPPDGLPDGIPDGIPDLD